MCACQVQQNPFELLEGATHSLRQRREDVRRLLLEWFAGALAAPDGGAPR